MVKLSPLADGKSVDVGTEVVVVLVVVVVVVVVVLVVVVKVVDELAVPVAVNQYIMRSTPRMYIPGRHWLYQSF
jgi:hypothetical protein